MKKILTTLLCLALCLTLLGGCRLNTATNENSSKSEQISNTPEISDPLADPELLMPKTLESIGLTATLPDGVRFHDINYGEYKNEYAPIYYENVRLYPENYTYKELAKGYEDLDVATKVIDIWCDNIGIGCLDNFASVVEFNVLSVQSYEWHSGTAQSHKYLIAGFKDNTVFTYNHIEPFVIYEDKGRLVIDTTQLLGNDFKGNMENYIKENEGKTKPAPSPDCEILTEIYDYSWLPEAFDLVVANKDKLIVPIEK